MSIVSEIKDRGDEAVRKWALELDGAEPARAVADASALPRYELLDLAARVRRWHEAQRPADIRLEIEPGVVLERRWVPLETVGIYVPRNLISTLVMCAVPAQAAGVRNLVVCTPPAGAGLVAAAAEVARDRRGVGARRPAGDRLARLRAQGGQDRRPGERIRERGEARGLARRRDRPAGRAVRGDRRSGWRRRPRLVELELAAQGEHGADAVCRVVATLEEAEAIAPEHLVLLGESEARAGEVRNAGAVFVGPWSPVPAGDYATGGNHVLPTGGWARSTGGLGLETFLKPVTTQRLTREGLELIRPTVEALAAAEGMPAHAAAVQR